MSAKLNIPNNNHGPVVRLAVVWGSGALIATGSLVRCLSAGKISVASSLVKPTESQRLGCGMCVWGTSWEGWGWSG